MDADNINEVHTLLSLSSTLLDYEIFYSGFNKQKSIAEVAFQHLENAIAELDRLKDEIEELRIKEAMRKTEEEYS